MQKCKITGFGVLFAFRERFGVLFASEIYSVYKIYSAKWTSVSDIQSASFPKSGIPLSSYKLCYACGGIPNSEMPFFRAACSIGLHPVVTAGL